MKFTIKRVSDLIAEGVLEHPMDGNHGEKHPKTSDYVKEGIPFILVPDLTNGKVDLDNCNFISEEQAKTLRKGFSKTGDVLFTHKATIGKVAIVDTREYPYIILTPQITYYRLKNSDVIDSKYLYYYFTSKPFQEHFKMFASSGGTRAYLGITAQEKLNIIYPDLERQKRIADILSTYDDLIENNNRRIALLEKAAQELYKEWFVRFRFPGYENAEFEDGLPIGWERTTFEKIASFQNGYAFKSEDLLGSSEEDTYEVFKQGHIKRGGGFKAEGTKSWYPKSKCTDLNKFVLHKNDILMAMTDMKDNVAILGNTALLPHDNRYILNQRVGLLRPTKYRKVGFAYIYLLTNSYDFVNDLRSRANRGVQVNLSATQIRVSETIVPSEEINVMFEQIINPIFEEIFNILNQNDNLTKQRDLLLPRLMSGKLEV